MKLPATSLLLLIALTLTTTAQTRISGRLTGSDGKPLATAHLHLMTEAGSTLRTIAKDGAFSLSTDQRGALRLFFSGVDHQPYRLYLYLERPDTIELDLRLAAFELEEKFDQIGVIGSFNNFDLDHALYFHPDSKGKWSIELPSLQDSLEYQFTDVARGRAINGTSTGLMRRNDAGGYVSVVPSPKGAARIVFDPARLVRGATTPVLTIRKASPRVEESIERYRAYEREIARHRTDLAPIPGLDPDSATAFLQEWTEETQSDLLARMATSRSEWDRQLLYAGWYDLMHALRRVNLPFEHPTPPQPLLPEVVPAGSPIWADAPDALALSLFIDSARSFSEPHFRYIDRIMSSYPEPGTRAQMAARILVEGRSLPAEWLRSLYSSLLRDDSNGPFLRGVQSTYGSHPDFLRPELSVHSMLDGILLDSNSLPVANARIEIERFDGYSSSETATSDSMGRFALPVARYGILRLRVWGKEIARHMTEFYIDRVTTDDVMVRLTGVVDTIRYDYGGAVARLQFVTPGSPLADVNRELQDLQERNSRARAEQRLRAARAEKGERSAADTSSLRDSRWTSINSTTDTLSRQLLLLDYVYKAGMSRGMQRDSARWTVLDSIAVMATIKEVPATSYLWQLYGQLSMFFVIASNRRDTMPLVADYLERIAYEHPDTDIRSQALYDIANNLSIDTAERPGYDDAIRRGRKAYATLVSLDPESHWAQKARSQFDPNRPIREGAPVPDFAWRSIDDDAVVYTPASLKGKYYLIDFWATWCGPCIAEMEPLHAAYKKFHGKGFEILSISYDGSPVDVQKHRSREWPMPWLHTFAEGAFDSPADKLFDVNGVPHTILVGPDGRIVAVDLRGDALAATLDQLLSK